MMLNRFFSIPVLFVFFLLGFVYYVTIFVFVEDWVGLQSSAGLLNALIFSLYASMCLFCLLGCVLTDPGGVPSGYVPDVEESQGTDQEIKRNGSHLRHCDKCSVHKPPRSHHCRVCGRCVLRMDHHCIWINNCVGLQNYKPFLLLVFYATFASAYSAIIIAISTMQRDWGYLSSLHHKNLYVVCGLITAGLSLVLGSLLVWHLYLTSHNMTTIEYHEGKRAAWLARKSGMTYRHPYDVGSYKNISLVSFSFLLFVHAALSLVPYTCSVISLIANTSIEYDKTISKLSGLGAAHAKMALAYSYWSHKRWA